MAVNSNVSSSRCPLWVCSSSGMSPEPGQQQCEVTPQVWVTLWISMSFWGCILIPGWDSRARAGPPISGSGPKKFRQGAGFTASGFLVWKDKLVRTQIQQAPVYLATYERTCTCPASLIHPSTPLANIYWVPTNKQALWAWRYNCILSHLMVCTVRMWGINDISPFQCPHIYKVSHWSVKCIHSLCGRWWVREHGPRKTSLPESCWEVPHPTEISFLSL